MSLFVSGALFNITALICKPCLDRVKKDISFDINIVDVAGLKEKSCVVCEAKFNTFTALAEQVDLISKELRGTLRQDSGLRASFDTLVRALDEIRREMAQRDELAAQAEAIRKAAKQFIKPS